MSEPDKPIWDVLKAMLNQATEERNRSGQCLVTASLMRQVRAILAGRHACLAPFSGSPARGT